MVWQITYATASASISRVHFDYAAPPLGSMHHLMSDLMGRGRKLFSLGLSWQQRDLAACRNAAGRSDGLGILERDPLPANELLKSVPITTRTTIDSVDCGLPICLANVLYKELSISPRIWWWSS
jgi:hypothetical protein